MTSTVFLVVAAIAFGAALVKAASMLGPRHQPGQGLLLVLLLTLAFSCFALSDKVQYQEDRVYHDLGRLLSNVSTMIAGFATLALPITLSQPLADARRRIRRYLLALAVCAGGMVVSFVMAAPLPETLGDFGGLYAARPELLVYIVLFLAFLGTALGELLILSARYSRLARRHPWLRTGLVLMGTGSALGLAYLAEKALYVFTQAAHLPPPFAGNQGCHSLLSPPQCVFSVTLPVAYVLLTATGATLPVWGEALNGQFRYYRNWRAFQELRPLWAAMHDAFPQVALDQPAEGPRWDLSFRLYRRVIEIDDGRLLLRPYMSAAVTEAATTAGIALGLRNRDLQAAVEAAEIAAALIARRSGAPADDGPLPERNTPGSDDALHEAAWLVQVAKAYVASPTARDIVRQGQAASTHPDQIRPAL